MTTIEIRDVCPEPPEFGLWIRIADLFRGVARWWREREELARLERLSPRVLRDIGFDPKDVLEASANPWDGLPGRYWDR